MIAQQDHTEESSAHQSSPFSIIYFIFNLIRNSLLFVLQKMTILNSAFTDLFAFKSARNNLLLLERHKCLLSADGMNMTEPVKAKLIDKLQITPDTFRFSFQFGYPKDSQGQDLLLGLLPGKSFLTLDSS